MRGDAGGHGGRREALQYETGLGKTCQKLACYSSVLQCVAVGRYAHIHSVLQCVAVCCIVL